ncbi:unnamed protein product [Arctogadus glacialis]
MEKETPFRPLTTSACMPRAYWGLRPVSNTACYSNTFLSISACEPVKWGQAYSLNSRAIHPHVGRRGGDGKIRGLLQPVYTRLYCALWWTAASPALWVRQASHLVALRWGLEAGYAEQEG